MNTNTPHVNFEDAENAMHALLEPQLPSNCRVIIEEICTDFLLKKINAKDLDKNVKQALLDYAKSNLIIIKPAFRKDLRFMFAYYDVARYQTDCLDAAIFWGIDIDILKFMLKRRPPPDTPAGRLQLDVPVEVKNIREIN